MSRVVCCDTGPVLHLTEIGALELLEETGAVTIPAAVAKEMDRRVAGWLLQKPSWIRVEALASEFAERAVLWQASGVLHSGEAESLALAEQIGADWYLTDDATARVLASSLGLEVHGTVGMVVWAAASEIVDGPTAHTLLNKLVNSSLWISPRVYAEARAALDQLTG